MKKFGLFWKIVLSICTISVVTTLVFKCYDIYNRKYSTYFDRIYYSESCEGLSYWNGQVKVVNKKTGKATTPRLNWVAIPDDSDSTTVFAIKRKRGYLNINSGKIMIDAQYDRAWKFSEGLAAVVKGNRLGFINPGGEVVIPFQYSYRPETGTTIAFLFKGGYCTAIGQNKKCGLINKSGDWKLYPEYEYITNPKHGYRVVKKGELYGVIDSLLQWTIPVQYDWINITASGFAIVKNNTQQLIAFDAKTVLQPFVYDQTEELHYNSRQVTQDGSDILLRSEYTAFEIHGKWGIMDKSGKVAIKACYAEINALSNDLFSCKTGDYWITLNAKGETVN